jgi:LmbE family N-acetylglucosaminyl deacetylase
VSDAPLRGEGTAEAAWRRWDLPASWPRLPLDLRGRVIVVSPHPDDETLGVGGLLWLLRRRSHAVLVVGVTDGESSHPATATRSAADLTRCRRAEQVAALAHLGIGGTDVVRLGLPDTAVSDHEADLADVLASLASADDWLIAPWEADGHRDHDAAGRAARRAADIGGARLLRYPLWAWHWTRPGHPALRSWRPLRVDLPDAALRAKCRAIDCYPSQTMSYGGDPPVVPAAMLDRHRRGWETLLT